MVSHTLQQFLPVALLDRGEDFFMLGAGLFQIDDARACVQAANVQMEVELFPGMAKKKIARHAHNGPMELAIGLIEGAVLLVLRSSADRSQTRQNAVDSSDRTWFDDR